MQSKVGSFRPCIVVPNFNHGYALGDLVESIKHLALPTIIVDDGSTDATPHILDGISSKYSWIIPIHREVNGGKGAAIRDGVEEAHKRNFSHALCIDGDGQHNVADIPIFLEAAERAPTALVLGAPRFGDDAPLIRRAGREISNVIVVLATWSFAARDVLCGFRVYPVCTFIEKLENLHCNPRMGFDAEIVIQFIWSGVKVINLPTPVRYPAAGVSHFHYGRDNTVLAKLYVRVLLEGLVRGPRRILRGVVGGASGRRPKHGVWYQIGEKGSVGGLRILLRILELLGRPPLLLVMVPVVLYLFLRGGTARQSALLFQRRILQEKGETFSQLKAYTGAFRQFWEFGVSIVDKVVSWRGGLPMARFVWSGQDAVKSHMRKGQGVIFMGAHVGNLEVIRALGDTENVIVNALMFTGNSRGFRAFLEEVNSNAFLRVHDLATVDAALIFTLQECIARGEIVALLADRLTKHSADRSVEVSLFGGSVQLPEGPWILASLLAAPVFTVFSMRGDDGLYHVELSQIAEKIELPRSDRAGAVQQYAAHFANKLEGVIRRYPHQWFNFFDFWGEMAKK